MGSGPGQAPVAGGGGDISRPQVTAVGTGRPKGTAVGTGRPKGTAVGTGRPKGTISLTTASSIAIANMVGTGVFTSLGFQLLGIRSGFTLLMLWVVGGVFALCGALSYGELAAALPRSGGEFNFLGRIYHPVVGFLAGWISVIQGFALPVALAAFAFGSYFGRVFPAASSTLISCLLVIAVTLAHLWDLRLGSWFQNIFTALKVGLILVFIGAAVLFEEKQPLSFVPQAGDWQTIFGAPFGISLLFVMYAYSGWNASTYIIDEVREPERTVPRSLLLATIVVLLLYLGLNWAFLVSAPMAEMAGQLEVGHVAALHIFGPEGGRLMSLLLSIALISSVSSMIWAGPRVTQVIGQDYSFFRSLARVNDRGVPMVAIVCQSALVLLLLLTTRFESLVVYTQFTLAISSALTVLGVLVLRRKAPQLPRPYKTWGYPLTPLIFLAIMVVTVIHTLMSHPLESLAGLATVLLGLPFYFLSRRLPAPPAVGEG